MLDRSRGKDWQSEVSKRAATAPRGVWMYLLWAGVIAVVVGFFLGLASLATGVAGGLKAVGVVIILFVVLGPAAWKWWNDLGEEIR